MQRPGFMLMLLALPNYLISLSHRIISLVEGFQAKTWYVSVNCLFFLYSSDNQHALLRDSTLFPIFSQVSNCQPDFRKYFQGLLYERAIWFSCRLPSEGLLCRVTQSKTKASVGKNSYFEDKRKTCLLSWSKTFNWSFALGFLFSDFTMNILPAHFLIYPISALLHTVLIFLHTYTIVHTFLHWCFTF